MTHLIIIATGFLILILLMAETSTAQTTWPQHQFWAYIGGNGNDGIALFKLDSDAGTLTPAGIVAAVNSPGFLAISPNQKFLYAITSVKTVTSNVGGVAGFSIDAVTGKLTAINQQPSEGNGPAFVTVDPSGRNVLVANYGSATVAVLPIDADGKLSQATSVIQQTGSSIDPQRQTHAYAHSINCDPAGKFAIVCDLGADKLFVYKLDASAGKLTPNDPPSVGITPGAGPRHLTFSPDGKFIYVLNEMGGTVNVFSYDADKGALVELQSTTTLKEEIKGSTCAEVQIDPTGRFLYASNRGTTNYVTIYSVNKSTGKLTLVGYQDSLGKTPRNFRIDPTGKYLLLANQNSNTLVLFAVDQQSGKLSPVGEPIPTVHGAMCVKFIPVDR